MAVSRHEHFGWALRTQRIQGLISGGLFASVRLPMKADIRSIECRSCGRSRPWTLVFLALLFLWVAVPFGCAKKYLQIVGTYQAETGEIISIHYSYPNYYLQLLKQASESPPAHGSVSAS